MDNLVGDLGDALTTMERERDQLRNALRHVLCLGLDLVKEPTPENVKLFEAALLSFPEDLRQRPPESGLVEVSSLLQKTRKSEESDGS